MSTMHLTGALAIVRVNGEPIGKLRNVRATENFRRVGIRGLGTTIEDEAPIVEWTGSVQCSFYEINFQSTGVTNAVRRDVQTKQEFEDNLLLDIEGVQIDIFKKIEDFVDPATGLRRAGVEPYAIIKRVLIESDSFDISEGTVSGHDQSFKYLEPLLYPV